MQKQFAAAMVAIMVMSAVLVMPVVSDNGESNDTQARANNEEMIRFASQKCIKSMIEAGLPSVEELSAPFGYTTSEQIKAADLSPNINISSCVYGDITGDSINDVVVHVTITDPVTNDTSTYIIAVDGTDGKTLWSKSFGNCAAIALPVGDLNSNNMNDVIIDIVMCILPERSYGAIIAVDGWNGTELWTMDV